MNWDDIVGHGNLKKLLVDSIDEKRISHAQLFVGKEGYGTLPLAMAFAREILRRENPAASSKVDHLNHLDLHFSFPVFKLNKSSETAQFFDQFREMILKNPYADSEDWNAVLESENKQLSIYVDEIEAISNKFALKSFEGGSKILIVWQADKMSVDSANKFLKFLEEPPEKTFIIFTAESTDDMLPTILSRTQLVSVPRISDGDMLAFLKKNYDLTDEKAAPLIFQSQGNWNTAQKLLNADNSEAEFEEMFILWVRDAFQVMKKPGLLKNIILWGRSIAAWNKEKQLNFLNYSAEMFRLAMLQNYGNTGMVYRKIESGGFKWEGFSRFIHGANIGDILEELSSAGYHLERNANSKIIWTDLGIKLTRYLHRKS